MGTWTNITSEVTKRQRWNSYITLIIALIKRDITSRYRRTFLGPLWTIIPAVMTMVVFNLLRGVVNIDSEGVPYVIFSFSTIVPWTYFQKAVSNAPSSIIGNGALLRKISVPREIFPFIGVCTALFDFFMSFLVLTALLILYQIPFTIQWLWLPLLIAMLSFLAWVVGIGIASVSVYRRDLLQGLSYILQFWFFASPVVYSFNSVKGAIRYLYALNPTVGIIDGFRQVLVFGKSPDIILLLVSFLGILLIGLITYPLYRSLSRFFVDVL